ncbi:MAG: hypothetical protein KGJ60_04805 [Verrucomicrobiota bacterium]|nr:hypothetical protein [Verrucomicrobiota bacterium]
MTDETDPPGFPLLEPSRRYAPLAAWAAVVLTPLFIPLKIIGCGYPPGDDALREAAKA